MRQPQPPKAIDALAEELCVLFSNYYQDLSADNKDEALKNYIEDNKTALLQMIFLCSSRNKLSKQEVVDGLLFFQVTNYGYLEIVFTISVLQPNTHFLTFPKSR